MKIQRQSETFAQRLAAWSDYDDYEDPHRDDYYDRDGDLGTFDEEMDYDPNEDIWANSGKDDPDQAALRREQEDAAWRAMEMGDDSEFTRDAADAERAHMHNTDPATYQPLIPPKDYGRNGPRPPLTMEPVRHWGTDGVMARDAVDGRPVGHLMFHPDGQIDTVNSHPDYHGKGVANAMLHYARSNVGPVGSGAPFTTDTGTIHHSSTLSPYGEAWARSDPHHMMPPASQIQQADPYVDQPGKKYQTYMAHSAHDYIPTSQPYTGQAEAHMKGSGFTGNTKNRQYVAPGMGYQGPMPTNQGSAPQPKIALAPGRKYKHHWPSWWDGLDRPDVPFPKSRMLLGEHPSPQDILHAARDIEAKGQRQAAAPQASAYRMLYHNTTPEAAASIRMNGFQKGLEKGQRPDAAFFSTHPDSDYIKAFGQGQVALRVPEKMFDDETGEFGGPNAGWLDDEFPNGEQHWAIPVQHLRRHWIQR